MTPEEHVPRALSREEVEKRGVRYVTNATASAMRAIAHGADPAQLIHGYLDAARILRLKLDEAERFIGDLSKDVAARDERIEALTEALRARLMPGCDCPAGDATDFPVPPSPGEMK